MPILLLAGFDLFGGCSVNTSWEVVKRATPQLPLDWSIRIVKLPVSWRRCNDLLREAWTSEVGAVIACGMAAINALHLERIAINLTTPEPKDVDGQAPPSEFVIPGAPPAYFSALPIVAIHQALKSENVPVKLSADCGTYLCNFIFYSVLHTIHSQGLNIPAGFIHIPNTQRPASPPLDRLVKGLERAVEITLSPDRP